KGALQDGATFLVTGTTAGASFPGGVTVVDVTSGQPDGIAGHDQDVTAGNLKLTNLVPGTYTIKETTPPTGFNIDPTTFTVIVTSSGQTDQNGDPFTPTFVDTAAANPCIHIEKLVNGQSDTEVNCPQILVNKGGNDCGSD